MFSYFARAVLVILVASTTLAAAENPPGRPPLSPLPSVEEMIQGLYKSEGLLTFYQDRNRGRVWLSVPPSSVPDEGHTYLYVEGLTYGLGSNDIGLDRGQIGPARLVGIRRVGGRILVEEKNTSFRALSNNYNERRSVREAFARSVLWGGEIVAQDRDGTTLVDFTSFIVRDAHGSAAAIEAAGQGSYALDRERSAVDPFECLAFPDNLEFEAVLTFGGTKPGPHVRSTVPEPQSITLVQHHSFVRLPDDGYHTRRFDPRAGSFAVQFLDYAAPLDQPMDTRYIVRHRLEKREPGDAPSRVRRPIVYYVDRGTPEAVRYAIQEGASWWAEAFEAAGFIDAFKVELLPEGVHPLDVRYNVIQWVHRATRGWSYGGGVIDPRTGEMIKGHVTLGSLRVRHDRLLFEGLAGTAKTGTGDDDDPVELALDRIRQLSAHEVGHTLGFAHNFAASTYGRGSVMDYPAPLVGIGPGGGLDFSQAYAHGIGIWDKHAVRYAYAQFPSGDDEDEALDAIVKDGLEAGLLFLTDEDARPEGAAHPLANLWDNGFDPVAALAQTMEVRRIALFRFNEDVVARGRPLALLHEALVPVYLHHRYQLDAAVKVIGGVEYSYAVRGDGQHPAMRVDPSRQREGLKVILTALEPERLDLPEDVLARLLPRPFGYDTNREMFSGQTDPVFDPLGAAATAADMVVKGLLQPQRAMRVIDQHRRDPGQPGFEEVLDALVAKAFAPAGPPRLAAIARVVQGVVVAGLVDLAADAAAPREVRALADMTLADIARRLEGAKGGDRSEESHRALLSADIRRHRDRQGAADPDRPAAPRTPPGTPIGEPPGSDDAARDLDR